MKMLSWMRTTKQNGSDPSKKYKGDFCCHRAQVSSGVQDIRTNSFAFSFSGPSHDQNPPGIEEELWFDEDGFCGFLAIGTLGTDPETPKFAASVTEENVTREKEVAILITKKLEKFLDEYPMDTSSNGAERSNAEGNKESDVCSLKGYDQFRSSIELAKRSNGGVTKRKGLLTSLFKRRQTVKAESSMERHDTTDLIKKIFQKLHGSSSKKRIDDDDYDSMPKKKDHRKSKVHPVLSTPARDDNKIDDRRRNCIKRCNLKVPSITGGFLGSSSSSEKSNKKRENWIKTDANYLVLEL